MTNYCVEKLHRLPSEVAAGTFELLLAMEATHRQNERERQAMERARNSGD